MLYPGTFPRTKTTHFMSVISAVRTTCGFTSSGQQLPPPVWVYAKTSLIKSLPHAVLISRSSHFLSAKNLCLKDLVLLRKAHSPYSFISIRPTDGHSAFSDVFLLYHNNVKKLTNFFIFCWKSLSLFFDFS
jgi:hypothetical protein